ncbi:MAG: Sir2 family NAD-dependent protein deacetylase [Syntrophomonadaceae bacterium]|nr:Sir2 family NAD-dependent protein deacetylase [Syntrophomonadaceae bacterium]
MSREIELTVNMLAKSKNTVVVTGAGISTEAGIPDFRGENGIYRRLGENRIMGIINIDFFRSNPLEFYNFYREHFMFPAVEPSKAHYMLARLEAEGFVKSIITQNIDNLHQKAGSKKVIPVHGNSERFICTARHCQKSYDSNYVKNSTGIIPYCSDCGGILKPDVILFGEQIYNYMDARDRILGARLLIVIGSSLTVYPLAGFVKEFSTFTQDMIIINKGRTQLDHAAIIKINTGHTGDLLEHIVNCLQMGGK